MVKLDSCIFPIGTKFVVSPLIKNGSYPPSSVGFIGCFNGQFRNSPNVVILNASIIRKGKRGKQRIENVLLTTQIFDIELKRKKLKLDEFEDYPFVHVVNGDDLYPNVADMKPIEFLGWGVAHFTYLATLYKDADVAKRWPGDGLNPVNVMGNMDTRFYEDPASTLDRYATEEFRKNFAYELRRMEAAVVKTVLQYRLKLFAAELKAAAYLLWDNLKEKDKLYSGEILVSNYNFYRREYTTLQRLIFKMDTARYESFVDKEKKSKLSYRMDKPAPAASVSTAHNLKKSFTRWISEGGGSPQFQNLVFRDNTKKVKAVEAAYVPGGYVVNEERHI